MNEQVSDPDGSIYSLPNGPLLEIVIDRPAKLNGFTPKMLREYAYAITAYEANANLRCALVRANGPHFTAGLDLPRVSEYWRRGEEVYATDALDMWDLKPPHRKKPLVIAVQGICFTVGVELMLSADIVVAADNCRFGQMEVKRGIMARGGATVRMVERAGWGNAMRYLLTGDEWNAETALRLNFIQEIVPAGQEQGRARELAIKIAMAAAPLAVQETRRNARCALEKGTQVAIAQFEEIGQLLRATDDATEGVRSFVEKRPPKFMGR